MHHLRILVPLAFAVLVAGCEQPPKGMDPAPAVQATMISPGATTAPAGAEGPVMAIVNGQPVYISRLYDLLVRGQGLLMAQQLILSQVVEQQAAAKGIAITDADLVAENGKLLKDIFGTVQEPEQRERMLVQFLNEKQISRQRWDLTVGMNARLRKLAQDRVKVTDESLKIAFEDQYGRKVLVRHIEMESLNELEKVIDQIKDKKDFAQLAQKFSRNPSASQGGELPPIGSQSPPEMPKAFRDAALALKQVGELSEPIRLGYTYHVIRLEKVVEPQKVKFDDVRSDVEARLRDRLTDQAKQQLMQEYLAGAKYEYVDPLLKALDNEEHAKTKQ